MPLGFNRRRLKVFACSTPVKRETSFQFIKRGVHFVVKTRKFRKSRAFAKVRRHHSGSWNNLSKSGYSINVSPGGTKPDRRDPAISIVDDSCHRNDRSREINADTTNSKPFNLGTTWSLYSSNALFNSSLVRFGVWPGKFAAERTTPKSGVV